MNRTNKCFIVVAGVLLFCLTSCAQLLNEKLDIGMADGSDGALSWSWKVQTHTLTLSGTADSSAPFTSARVTGVPLELVHTVQFGDGITALGDRAFEKLPGLATLTIPATVTSVGSDLFSGLTKIDHVSIAGDVAHWNSSWYGNFTSFDKLSFYETNGAITYSWSGTTLTLNASAASTFTAATIREPIQAYTEQIEIGSNITGLGDSAFSGYTKLSSLTIPATVTSAGKNIFSGISAQLTIKANASTWTDGWYNGYVGIGWCAYFDSTGAKTLLVFGSGAIPDYGKSPQWDTSTKYSTAPWMESYQTTDSSTGEEVTTHDIEFNKIIIAEGITSIGNSSFNSLYTTDDKWMWSKRNITSISLPSTLQSIGDFAFYRTQTASITIPQSVTYIGNKAFGDWGSSKPIIVLSWPSTDTTGRTLYGLYSDCTATVVYSDGIYYGTSNGTTIASPYYTVYNGVLTIAGNGSASWSPHPWNDSEITSIVVKSGITSLNSSYHYDSTKMTWIYTGLFQNMPNVTSVSLPDMLTYIGENTFAGDTSLSTITIPSSVTTIYSDAFSGWTSAQTINLGWAMSSGYGNCISASSTSAKIKYSDGNYYQLVNGTLTVGATGALSYSTGMGYCWTKSNITAVVVDSGVTEIGSSFFSNMSSLTSVALPDTLTSIESWAFYSDTAISSITIPSSVTYVNAEAFYMWLSSQTIRLGWASTDSHSGSFTGLSSSNTGAKVYYSDDVLASY